MTDIKPTTTRWLVYSPDYSHSGGSFEPPEYAADVVEVETDRPSYRDAIMLGAKLMSAQGMSWVRDNGGDNLPPWAGLKAERMSVE